MYIIYFLMSVGACFLQKTIFLNLQLRTMAHLRNPNVTPGCYQKICYNFTFCCFELTYYVECCESSCQYCIWRLYYRSNHTVDREPRAAREVLMLLASSYKIISKMRNEKMYLVRTCLISLSTTVTVTRNWSGPILGPHSFLIRVKKVFS